MPLVEGPIYRFREFSLDPIARTLKRDGIAVEVSRRSFDLLLFLVQNPGRILSKDELLRRIWQDTSVDENSLAKSVSLLRRALEVKPEERSPIVTLPGAGYQFAEHVEIEASVSEEELHAVLQGEAARSEAGASIEVLHQKHTVRTSIREVRGQRVGLTLWGWVAAVLVLLLSGGGGALWWRHVHPVRRSALVVLASFENTTGDNDFDYALNRAFQIELEQTPFLDILPRSTVTETLVQMQHGPDETLTPEVAREVCERNDAQVVLSGSIAPFAGRYLLMVTATSCVTGKSVAGYQKQVSSKGEVLPALDMAVGRVREQLGESAASLGKFQTPIAQATTGSLEALRVYTQGLEALDRGDTEAGRVLFERAIARDDHFASAWKALGILYHNRGDHVRGAELIEKAYGLRERATERERLTIEIEYYELGNGDYEAAVSSMRLYNAIFPNDPAIWFDLSNTYTYLGQTEQAVEAGEYAYRLAPHSGKGAEILARAYRRANRFMEAKRVAEAAIAEGKDRWDVHSLLFQVAFLEHDAARMKAEGEWGVAHQQAGQALEDLGFVAASEGRLREAVRDFTEAWQEGKRSGDLDFADGATMYLAGILWEYGYPREAAASLKQMRSDAIDAGTTAEFEAQLGNLAPAQRLIAKIASSGTKNTLNLYFDLPELRSLLALKTHRAEEAIEDLEPARKYQMRDIGVPYQRARAETEAGELEQAIGDYRLILDHPGINPIWPEYTLSHLRLAHVLVLDNRPDQARAEYEAFLKVWRDADGDVPLLIEARREYAQLSAHAQGVTGHS